MSNSKMKANAMMLASLAMMGNNFMATGSGDEMEIFLPKEPIPPKGCSEYFFNEQGEFSTTTMRKDECVFKCFAINDKNAKRKFERWERQHPSRG